MNKPREELRKAEKQAEKALKLMPLGTVTEKFKLRAHVPAVPAFIGSKVAVTMGIMSIMGSGSPQSTLLPEQVGHGTHL